MMLLHCLSHHRFAVKNRQRNSKTIWQIQSDAGKQQKGPKRKVLAPHDPELLNFRLLRPRTIEYVDVYLDC
jgi:hypothetical protein